MARQRATHDRPGELFAATRQRAEAANLWHAQRKEREREQEARKRAEEQERLEREEREILEERKRTIIRANPVPDWLKSSSSSG